MSENPSTKQRLIEAAGALFSERGYRATTVAEICEAADANIASVNYHFGDKESLYDAVWHHAFELTSRAHPIDGSLPEDPELSDFVFSYANALMHRIFSENTAGIFPKLLHQEMSNPTLALERIADEVLKPQSMFLGKMVREALKHDVPQERIRLCMHSIVGQCAFYNFSRPLRERIMGDSPLTDAEITTIAQHITTFSMGGLNATKEEHAP